MDTVNIVNEKNYQRCFELYAMNLYVSIKPVRCLTGTCKT